MKPAPVPAVSPAAKARFLGIVENAPGLTLEELTARLERTHDRMVAPLVVGYLHQCRTIRRDDEGRYWPT